MYIINLEFRFNVVLITILVLLFTLQYHRKKKDTLIKKNGTKTFLYLKWWGKTINFKNMVLYCLCEYNSLHTKNNR